MWPDPLMVSALCRLVGEVEHARVKCLRIHELQCLLIAPFLEEALRCAHDDGMNHERKLVEEVVGQQQPDEGAAADDRNVLAGLPREGQGCYSTSTTLGE
jgi:hypothetical protein